MRIPPRLTTLAALVCAFSFLTSAFAQQNWHWTNMLPASERWTDVAYGNGTYVMVGGDGTIISSPDAANWTVRHMSATNGVGTNAVAFANGLFVAVGGGTPTNNNGPAILTSPDGITWTLNETVAAQNFISLTDVVFGNGLFVAAASSSRVFTSPDGLTWTLRDVGQFILQGAFGSGKFVFTNSSNSLLVSSDGINYAKVAVAPSSGSVSAVTFANGKFVALGRDSNFNAITYVSSDAGTTWTASATIGSNSPFLQYLGANGTAFVTAGSVNGGGATLYSSTDGLTWTLRTPATAQSRSTTPGSVVQNQFGSVGSANDLLFATGIYGDITTSSDNGVTWTRRSTGTAHDINGLVHDGTRFVGVGTGGTVVTSPDGVTWTATTSDKPTAWFGQLAFSNGRYVTGGSSGLFQSSNLTNWTSVITNGINGVIYANNLFVAVGTSVSTMRTSADGVTWATVAPIQTSGSLGSVQGLAGGGGSFVVVTGSGGGATKVFSSTNGATWADSTPSTLTTVPESLAYNNGRYVMLTTGQSWTSTNGSSWTLNPLTGTGIAHVLAVGNTFVARKQIGGYMNSTDGVTWSDIADSVGPNALATAMVAKDGKVVYTSGGGTILLGDFAGVAAPGPAITTQPAAQAGVIGGSVTFSVAAAGTGNTYQWRKDGAAISGATSATLTLNSLIAANAGTYTVIVTNTAGGTTTSSGATLTLVSASAAGRLANMSIRTGAGTGDNTLIVGLGLGGAGTSGNKAVLIRGVGPTLGAFGVGGTLADPVMTVFQGQTTVATNDDWAGSFDFTSVGAFALSGTAPRDAAIYNATMPAGSYSIQITGKNNATGIALAEIYDATPGTSFAATTPRLVNVSARTQVGTGDNILIAGFAVGGQSSVRVLIRAVGPTLGGFGVSGSLADPKLEIYSGSTKINENDNWGGTAELKAAFSSVAAFAFSADNSRDAALVATLQPGTYTAQISGVGATTGVALVELYELP